MHILSQGQLEDITLPASSKARSGYRPQGLTSSASSTSYASRLNSSIPPNIQLLDPDEIIENVSVHYQKNLDWLYLLYPRDDSLHGGLLLLLCPYVCMYIHMYYVWGRLKYFG